MDVRRKYGIAVLLAVLLAPVTYLSAWNIVQQEPTAMLMDLCFLPDGQHGWTVGCVSWGGRALSNVIRTTDGGTNWSRVAFPGSTTVQLQGVCFATQNSGWVVGSGGWIYATTDGGNTWLQQTSGTTKKLARVCFINSSQGWICGGWQVSSPYQYLALKTTDGGVTWQDFSFGSDCYSCNDIFFYDDSNGWIVGLQRLTLAPVIYRTTDGGSSWVSQTVPGGVGFVKSVDFATVNKGWISCNGGAILHTTDGGTNWTIQGNTGKDYGYAIDCQDTLNIAIASQDLSNRMYVYVSSDGGESWTPNEIESLAESVHGIQYIGDDIWIAANFSQILHSTDNGTNWNREYNAPGLRSIAWADSLNGWAVSGSYVGTDGDCYRTTDGGVNWFNDTSAPGGKKVMFVDDQNGWMLWEGSFSSVWRTTDGGSTWNRYSIPSGTDWITDMFFISPDSGWVCGQDGKLLVTINGGQTWSTQTSGTTGYLQDIYFLDTNEGWVVGRYGWIGHTTNGGANWAAQTAAQADYFSKCFFLNNQEGWLATLECRVHKTTDGGASWQVVSQTSEYSSADILMKDSNIGWYVTRNGLGGFVQNDGRGFIYRTTNGGTTWQLEWSIPWPGSSIAEIGVQSDISNELLWASGWHNTILKLGKPAITHRPSELIFDYNYLALLSGMLPEKYFTRRSANKLGEEVSAIINSSITDEFIPVFIMLSKQLNPDYLIYRAEKMTKPDRRQFVINECKTLTSESQKELLLYLEDRKRQGKVLDIVSLWSTNTVCLKVKPEIIKELAKRDDIWKIGYSEPLTIIDRNRSGKSDYKKVEFIPDNAREICWGVAQINADDVWAQGYTGTGIVVGCMDSGVNYDHTDLLDHMWDGSGAGYPNHGWDFVSNDNDPDDSDGHGTKVAGIVAGDGTSGSNTGVAPDAQVMALRIYPGTNAEMGQAIDFALENNADLLSCSIGWGDPSSDIKDWCRAQSTVIYAAGIVWCNAAGNGDGLGGHYPVPQDIIAPGCCPGPWYAPNSGNGSCMAIGATDDSDDIAYWSSYGPTVWNSVIYGDYLYPPGLIKPDVSAPGVNCKSLHHWFNDDYSDGNNGTSFAQPYVAGTIALMLSKQPSLTPRQIDSLLQNTAIDIEAPGRDSLSGAGRIDALAAVNAMSGGAQWGDLWVINQPSATDILHVNNITEAQNSSWLISTVPNGFSVPISDSHGVWVTVDTTGQGLAFGQTYNDTLLIWSNDTYHNPDKVPVTLIMPAADNVPPSAPSLYAEKWTSASSIKLSWNKVTTDILGNAEAMDHYTVYRSTIPDFIPGASDSIAGVVHPDTVYTDANALNAGDNYYYLVKAIDQAENRSAKSNMGYKLNKFVNENAGATGDRNWVSLPWYSEYDSVLDLTADLSPAGDPLTKITDLRDDQVFENWIYHPVLGWYGDTFDINAGRGYEMIVTTDDTVILVGSNDPAGLISLNENPGAPGDRNWVSIPYNALYDRAIDITDEYSSGGEAVIKITDLRDEQIFQNWIYHPVLGWYGDTFDISAGRAYELVAVLDTIWNPTEYTNESGFDRLAARHKKSDVKVRLGTLTNADRVPLWVVEEEVSDKTVARVYKPVARSVSLKKGLYRESGVSHLVRAEFDAGLYTDLVFTAYRLNKPYDVLTEQVIGGGIAQKHELGVLWFDVGNFMQPWQHDEEMILIIEALHEHGAYCQVLSVRLDQGIDIQELGKLEFEPIPMPKPVLNSAVSWSESKNPHVIGYSIYQDDIRKNYDVIQTSEYSISKDITLKLVIRGGYETVYNSGSKRSEYGPVVELPRIYAFTVYPNPFIKKTMINYALPEPGQVSIMVYDVTGRKVMTLVNGRVDPGYYQMHWSGRDDLGRQVSAGVYFMRMNTPGFNSQQKVIFVR